MKRAYSKLSPGFSQGDATQGQQMTDRDPRLLVISPPEMTLLMALPRVVPADIEAAATRMTEAVLRLRVEPLPEATWDSEATGDWPE